MKYISLGYFCSVAMELERFGLRDQSSPFDWVLVEFDGVIDAIENRFEDFLSYEYLEQSRENRRFYRNFKYKIEFRHDFDDYLTLQKQLKKVQEKYNRRIERFYETIKEPTVFVRYISDEELIEGKSQELNWIEKNWDKIETTIKKYNSENKIIFIANEGVTSEIIPIYNVQPDLGDIVARTPADKNLELYDFFKNAVTANKNVNLNYYMEKQRKNKKSTIIIRKSKRLLKKIFLKKYIHNKEY